MGGEKQGVSAIDQAEGYIDKFADKSDKFKRLEKIDKDAAAIDSYEDDTEISLDWKAPTEAYSLGLYGESYASAKMGSAKRNVILNIHRIIVSHGLNLKGADKISFNFANNTFTATVDGQKLKPKQLKFVEAGTGRETVMLETARALKDHLGHITAEAHNLLATYEQDIEPTTAVRKAIESNSIVNVHAALGLFDDLTIEERTNFIAHAAKQFKEGAAGDITVGWELAGINHYLDEAGQGGQKIDLETGEGYTGSAEQNRAWVKYIDDVISGKVEPYLEEYRRAAPERKRERTERDERVEKHSPERSRWAMQIERNLLPHFKKDFPNFEVEGFVLAPQDKDSVNYTFNFVGKENEELKYKIQGEIKHEIRRTMQSIYEEILEKNRGLLEVLGYKFEEPAEEPADADATSEEPAEEPADADATSEDAPEKAPSKAEQKQQFYEELSEKMKTDLYNYVDQQEASINVEDGPEVAMDIRPARPEGKFTDNTDFIITITSVDDPTIKEEVGAYLESGRTAMIRIERENPDYLDKDLDAVRGQTKINLSEPLADTAATVRRRVERKKERKKRKEVRTEAREARAEAREAAREADRAEKEAAKKAPEAAPEEVEAIPMSADTLAQIKLLGGGGEDAENPDIKAPFNLQGADFVYKSEVPGLAVTYEAEYKGLKIVLFISNQQTTITAPSRKEEDGIISVEDVETNVNNGEDSLNQIKPAIQAGLYAVNRLIKNDHYDPATGEFAAPKTAEELAAETEAAEAKEVADKAEFKKRLGAIWANPEDPTEDFFLFGERALEMEYNGTGLTHVASYKIKTASSTIPILEVKVTQPNNQTTKGKYTLVHSRRGAITTRLTKTYDSAEELETAVRDYIDLNGGTLSKIEDPPKMAVGMPKQLEALGLPANYAYQPVRIEGMTFGLDDINANSSHLTFRLQSNQWFEGGGNYTLEVATPAYIRSKENKEAGRPLQSKYTLSLQGEIYEGNKVEDIAQGFTALKEKVETKKRLKKELDRRLAEIGADPKNPENFFNIEGRKMVFNKDNGSWIEYRDFENAAVSIRVQKPATDDPADRAVYMVMLPERGDRPKHCKTLEEVREALKAPEAAEE